MTLRELKRLADKWQQRLNLPEWIMKVRWADLTDSEDAEDAKNKYAWANTLVHAKTSELVFVHPDNYEDDKKLRENDFEVLVAHELLHLHFAPFQTVTGSAEEVVEENIIDMLSRLLVSIERGDAALTGRKDKLRRAAVIKPCDKRHKGKEETKRIVKSRKKVIDITTTADDEQVVTEEEIRLNEEADAQKINA